MYMNRLGRYIYWRHDTSYTPEEKRFIKVNRIRAHLVEIPSYSRASTGFETEWNRQQPTITELKSRYISKLDISNSIILLPTLYYISLHWYAHIYEIFVHRALPLHTEFLHVSGSFISFQEKVWGRWSLTRSSSTVSASEILVAD